jgi:hypothetical protein
MESHKTETPLPSIATFSDFSTINFTALTEVVFEFTPPSFPRKVPNKELASFFSGGALHVGVIMAILVPSATFVVSTTMVVSSSLLTVLADKNGATMELGVLEFTNGTGSFGWFLVDDNATALGTTIVAF